MPPRRKAAAKKKTAKKTVAKGVGTIVKRIRSEATGVREKIRLND